MAARLVCVYLAALWYLNNTILSALFELNIFKIVKIAHISILHILDDFSCWFIDDFFKYIYVKLWMKRNAEERWLLS